MISGEKMFKILQTTGTTKFCKSSGWKEENQNKWLLIAE